MDKVERFDGVATVDDAGYVDLVGALADHLDVHVSLRKRREHAPGDADHVAHLFAHHREDRHVAVHRHLKGTSRPRRRKFAKGYDVHFHQQTQTTLLREPEEERRRQGEWGEKRNRRKKKKKDARCRFFLDRARDALAACGRARPRSPC